MGRRGLVTEVSPDLRVLLHGDSTDSLMAKQNADVAFTVGDLVMCLPFAPDKWAVICVLD